MNWGVVCKPNARNAVSLAHTVYEFLSENGKVFAEKGFAKAADLKGYSLKELNEKVDIVVTIGGDGTILLSLQDVDKPIFAINSGGMGFLAEVESKYAVGGLQRIVDGDFNVEERSKLKILVDEKRLPDATNEATVQNARIAKILYFKVFIDDELVESLGADGVIVATPTGSTSYSLSVGGPLMDPSVNAMIIAPLAPFKLSARPWIVPLEKKVGIRLMAKSKESQIVIDGHFAQSVSPESSIEISCSERKARFVRFGESFYQMVRLKLVR